MDQYAESLKGSFVVPDQSDNPTETYVTPKAIMFYISSAVTVICMFLNWFPLKVDLGIMQFNDVLGTVNIFTLVSAAMKVKGVGGLFGAYLPNSVTVGFAFVLVVSIALLLAAIAAVLLYVYAIILRIQGNDRTVRTGQLAALLAIDAAAGFIVLLSCCLVALDLMDILGRVIGIVLTGPCMFTIVGGILSGYCAVRDRRFKEDVVIYHNGVIKIDKGPKWRCRRCHRKNLSRLTYCYYCGDKKQTEQSL